MSIMKNSKDNILEEARRIIFERAEEKERDYGPIDESMEKASKIFELISGINFSAEDMYKAMIALKLSRMSRGYKKDTYLDLVGYLGALEKYLNSKNK